MDFRTGNSGNCLVEAVLKVGPGCQQEGAYCQHLGASVAPRIYAIIPDGYVMEALEPAPRDRELLCRIEALLAKTVWNRPALPNTSDISWRQRLKDFGVNVPAWVIPTDPCLVHGDPTASNALIRYQTPKWVDKPLTELVLCDPRPPRDFIPQCRETDMGRILQSYLGWEVAAYGAPKVIFERPTFFFDDYLIKAAFFWCGAAAARIKHLELSRERRKNILDWCDETIAICYV